jgi:hypothetical protein
MRTWAVTKASRHKNVLSWIKTTWVMVRSMSELRQSTRRSARQSSRERMMQKIRKLITIWVSDIVKVPPLNPLTPEAKLIQVTSTDTKLANKNFLSRPRGFFPHFSHRVEGRLWIGWIVGFGWFDCFHFFVIVGSRNKLRSTPHPCPHISQNQYPICMWILWHSPQLYSDRPQLFSRSKQFSKNIQSNRQPPTEAQCSLW